MNFIVSELEQKEEAEEEKEKKRKRRRRGRRGGDEVTRARSPKSLCLLPAKKWKMRSRQGKLAEVAS